MKKAIGNIRYGVVWVAKKMQVVAYAQLNPMALGYAGAAISALCMVLASAFSPMGYYMGAANMMRQWSMFYGPSAIGILLGTLEAAVIGFIAAYVLAIAYNKFSE